jgi:two-component system, chemotaxis family, sensor kinase CheA
MSEFIDQFILESRELVETATRDLLGLEQDPTDAQKLDSVFRAFHTLKGGAAIVDFSAMARAMHAAEEVLAAARRGNRPLTPTRVGECLECLDQVVQWLDMMQVSKALPDGADAVADAIQARLAGEGEAPTPESPKSGPAHDDWLHDLLEKHASAVLEARCAFRYAPDRDCFFRGEDPVALLGTLGDLLASEIEPASPWPALDALDPFACNLVFTALTKKTATDVAAAFASVRRQVEIMPIGEAAALDAASKGLTPSAREVLRAQIQLLAVGEAPGALGRVASAARTAINVLRHVGLPEQAGRLAGETDPTRLIAALEHMLGDEPARNANKTAPAPASRDFASRTLRIDAERVDRLVDLTGELIIAKNAIGHTAKLAQDSGSPLAAVLKNQHAQLDNLIVELQKSVLSLRVLPLRHVFQRFPRLIREMSVKLGRPVNFATEGDDTEADKVIVEALYEPLLHVMRNAMDHGVEPMEQRTALGKASTATISMRGSRQGENVVVEVEDDGRGIDLAKVRQKAVERGLVSAESLASYSDAEAIELIFSPGFSTASEVSDISGRGVGMDAARAAIEGLGGRISIESRENHGSVVRFVLPFSVMMTRVLTVAVGEQMFGIPLEAVVETVRAARETIFPIGASQAFVLRNRTVPVIDLAETLDYRAHRRATAIATLLIISIAGQFGAIEVDRLGERMDVMLKPMDGILAGTPGLAGATLLGDGKVLLILDVQELLL